MHLYLPGQHYYYYFYFIYRFREKNVNITFDPTNHDGHLNWFARNKEWTIVMQLQKMTGVDSKQLTKHEREAEGKKKTDWKRFDIQFHSLQQENNLRSVVCK